MDQLNTSTPNIEEVLPAQKPRNSSLKLGLSIFAAIAVIIVVLGSVYLITRQTNTQSTSDAQSTSETSENMQAIDTSELVIATELPLEAEIIGEDNKLTNSISIKYTQSDREVVFQTEDGIYISNDIGDTSNNSYTLRNAENQVVMYLILVTSSDLSYFSTDQELSFLEESLSYASANQCSMIDNFVTINSKAKPYILGTVTDIPVSPELEVGGPCADTYLNKGVAFELESGMSFTAIQIDPNSNILQDFQETFSIR